MIARHHDEQVPQRFYVSSGFLAMLLVALPWIGSLNGMSPSAWADQLATTDVHNSNAGQITAVGATDLEVEHRSYPLHPKLEIRTESGQPLELKQLQVGMGVRLQLKDGAVGKVLVLNPK